jgi:trk system potassium uptake protein TrkH
MPKVHRPRFGVAARVIGGLLAMVTAGTLILMLPPMGAERALTFAEAAFTAVSALTVTGLTVITPATDLSPLGQWTLLLLIQLGGVGYVVLAVVVFHLLGRQISLADRLSLRDALGVLSTRGIAQLAQKVFAGVLAIEMAGAVALYLHWSRLYEDPNLPFVALFHAVAAFCNAGFETFTGNPQYPNGVPVDGLSLLIKGVLIVMGGLGIPVLYELFSLRRRNRLSLHSRLTLKISAILVVWGAFALWISESRPGNVLDGLPLFRQIEIALFQSVSCRAAGYVGMPAFETIDPASQLLIVTLMAIGCAPASMGGGLTTGTLLVMVLALAAYLRGQSTPIVGGRAIPGEMVRKAAAVLTISLFAVLTSAWLLMLTHPVSFELAIFEAVSAFATSGLTLGFTQELNGYGLAIVMMLMLWGRLGALTLLVILTRPRAERRLTYPEEKILIG